MIPEPIIPVPLSVFLQLLWGYKKNVELKDRAVPGEQIVQLLKEYGGPPTEGGFHFQEQEGAQTIVWQLAEWKTSGERQMTFKVESEKQNSNADTIAEAIYKKAPMLGKEFCRTLAHNLVKSKDFSCLAPFGLSEKDFKL